MVQPSAAPRRPLWLVWLADYCDDLRRPLVLSLQVARFPRLHTRGLAERTLENEARMGGLKEVAQAP